ncbi:MAG: type II toxin-antitoxin system RelE/ParE family toxin [Cyclobacteriaceae bacterium]
MKTVWTPLGLKSLDKTTNFIEEHWNKAVANAFLDRLDERVEQLKQNPRIGPTYQRTSYRQLTIHPLVTLYYELKTDYIGLVLV